MNECCMHVPVSNFWDFAVYPVRVLCPCPCLSVKHYVIMPQGTFEKDSLD